VEVRKCVAVDLVVHLDRLHYTIDRGRDGHRVLPEHRLLLGRHLEGLDVVRASHDAHIARQWPLVARGGPAGLELGDNIERTAGRTDDAALWCSPSRPLAWSRPHGPVRWSKVRFTCHEADPAISPAASSRGDGVGGTISLACVATETGPEPAFEGIYDLRPYPRRSAIAERPVTKEDVSRDSGPGS
jgi:hypothetical protein